MKTIKVVLITVLISFSMVTFANTLNTNLTGTRSNLSKQAINMAFEHAIMNHYMVREMHKQIHMNTQVGSSCPHTITHNISFRNRHIRITGTYDQWREFFMVLPEKTYTQKKHRDK